MAFLPFKCQEWLYKSGFFFSSPWTFLFLLIASFLIPCLFYSRQSCSDRRSGVISEFQGQWSRRWERAYKRTRKSNWVFSNISWIWSSSESLLLSSAMVCEALMDGGIFPVFSPRSKSAKERPGWFAGGRRKVWRGHFTHWRRKATWVRAGETCKTKGTGNTVSLSHCTWQKRALPDQKASGRPGALISSNQNCLGLQLLIQEDYIYQVCSFSGVEESRPALLRREIKNLP